MRAERIQRLARLAAARRRQAEAELVRARQRLQEARAAVAAISRRRAAADAWLTRSLAEGVAAGMLRLAAAYRSALAGEAARAMAAASQAERDEDRVRQELRRRFGEEKALAALCQRLQSQVQRERSRQAQREADELYLLRRGRTADALGRR